MHRSSTAIFEDNSTIVTSFSILAQCIGVILLAIILVYGVGFASVPEVHNAAHDTRHAVAFPCH
jgi:cobalt transporter subunit CbtB